MKLRRVENKKAAPGSIGRACFGFAEQVLCLSVNYRQGRAHGYPTIRGTDARVDLLVSGRRSDIWR